MIATNDHEPEQLKTTECILSQFWRPELCTRGISRAHGSEGSRTESFLCLFQLLAEDEYLDTLWLKQGSDSSCYEWFWRKPLYLYASVLIYTIQRLWLKRGLWGPGDAQEDFWEPNEGQRGRGSRVTLGFSSSSPHYYVFFSGLHYDANSFQRKNATELGDHHVPLLV